MAISEERENANASIAFELCINDVLELNVLMNLQKKCIIIYFEETS